MASVAMEMTGKTFGRLTILARAENSSSGKVQWSARCECGALVVVKADRLRSGMTRSCGCIKREMKPRLRHGWSHKSEHTIWMSMRQRCENKNNKAYARYGGRGIVVCERWHVFENFMADMGPRPSEDHSIDRIDNDRGYEPDNCRWATRSQQVRNSRKFRGGHVDKTPKADLIDSVLLLERENAKLSSMLLDAISVALSNSPDDGTMKRLLGYRSLVTNVSVDALAALDLKDKT